MREAALMMNHRQTKKRGEGRKTEGRTRKRRKWKSTKVMAGAETKTLIKSWDYFYVFINAILFPEHGVFSFQNS